MGSPVLVACSGGADSLALLHLLRGGPWPLHVAYLDHGETSQRSVLAAISGAWGLPFHSRRLRVSRWARRYGLSWEAAGRQLRYLWLRRLAGRLGALVVTGHTADDQAETLLLRLVQGTSLAGLGGIREFTEGVARPLLGCRRAQLEDYLRAQDVDWWEDPMNKDQRFLRVALRRQVLPVLEELNPAVVGHLCRLAEDAATLRWETPAPLAAQTRLQFEHWLHSAWTRLNRQPWSRWERHHAERIHRALKSEPRGRWDLPGRVWAEWDGARLRLGRTWLRLPLLERGAEEVEGKLWGVRRPEESGLEWRVRRPGDRWRGRSLKKCFQDWKVPRAWRDRLPVLVLPPHEVVWIPGYAADSRPGPWVYSLEERNDLLIVEAAARDETAPR